MYSQRRDRFKKKRKNYAIESMLFMALLSLFVVSYLMYNQFATGKLRRPVVDSQLWVYRQARLLANQTPNLDQKRKIFAGIVEQYPQSELGELARRQIAKIDQEFVARKQECRFEVERLVMRQEYLAASYHLKRFAGKYPALASDLDAYKKSLRSKLDEIVVYELQKAATLEMYGDGDEAKLKIHALQQKLPAPGEWQLSRRYRKILDQIREQRKH